MTVPLDAGVSSPAPPATMDETPKLPPPSPGAEEVKEVTDSDAPTDMEDDTDGGDALHDVQAEREKIKSLASFKLQPGAMYYLVSMSWWQQWSQFVGFDSGEPSGHPPGPIDNNDLLRPGSSTQIRTGVSENRDYMFATLEMWNLLCEWYTSNGPTIARRGITEYGRTIVDLHGVSLELYRHSELPQKPQPRELVVSRSATVRELKDMACQAFGIEPAQAKIWDYFQKKLWKALETPSAKLNTLQIMENQAILVEEKDSSGRFVLRKELAGGSSSMSDNAAVSSYRASVRGVVGLQNLGNTCFMNSTLQCLSNIPRLRAYFASGAFEREINRENPLGQEGKLAESYGALMQMMWPADDGAGFAQIAPRGFKHQMGVFRPEFQGYQQHDSSELLNFLLDGLHEDLNRVPEPKPYVESVESSGKPDIEVAPFALHQYMRRNNSFIHDLFRGQFKSTLVCPSCQNVSVTFDPYTMVSLPLRTTDEEMKAFYKLKFWGQEEATGKRFARPMNVGVRKGSRGAALRSAVAEAAGVAESRVIIAQLYYNRISRFIDDTTQIEFLTSSHGKLIAFDVDMALPFFYEKPHYSYSQSASRVPANLEVAAVVVYFKKQASVTTSSSSYSAAATYTQTMGDPVLFCHPKATSQAQLCQAIATHIHPDLRAEQCKVFFAKVQYGKLDPRATPLDSTDTAPILDGLDPKCVFMVEFPLDVREEVEQLEIPGYLDVANEPEAGSSKSGAADLTLQDCFQLFSTPEKLSPEDSWYCPKCKQHVEATKTMQLWSVPPVLILHLKRFSYTRYFRNKVEKTVTFPLEDLDMSPFVVAPPHLRDPNGASEPEPGSAPSEIDAAGCTYDLVAVSNHMGSLGGGHYTASAKSSEDGRWYKFNDSSTAPMQPGAVVSGDAYLLVYVRRETGLARNAQDASAT